jgi:hypothetical protein
MVLVLKRQGGAPARVRRRSELRGFEEGAL